jgi:hypothetical protein
MMRTVVPPEPDTKKKKPARTPLGKMLSSVYYFTISKNREGEALNYFRKVGCRYCRVVVARTPVWEQIRGVIVFASKQPGTQLHESAPGVYWHMVSPDKVQSVIKFLDTDFGEELLSRGEVPKVSFE